MSEFSIQDAAFTGFGVVRDHPRALAAWALYALAVSLIFGPIVFGTYGPDFVKLLNMGWRQESLADTLALFRRLAPAFALEIAIGLVSNAILGAAFIRSVLRPGDDRFGFLRLGVDEARQLGLGILTFLVFCGAYLGLAVAVTLFAVILATLAPATAPLLGVLLVLVVGAGMGSLAVRLSLAPALTFDHGRIELFESWRLTRGRFWPLAGTYLLTAALFAVVYLLCELVISGIGAVLTLGGSLEAPADPRSLAAWFTPRRLLETVLGAGVSALVWPVLLTPPTAVYRALASSRASAADAFS